MAFLVLDIETIPRPTIDESVEEVIAQKTQARVERTGDDPENAESLIRSTSPFFGQVLCIGLRWLQDDGTSKDKVICEENEEATLNTFFNIINHSSSKNARYIHYNGLGFDIPFLMVRGAHYGIEINNWNFKDLRRFSFKTHIDLMMFLCNWNNYNAVSMDIACRSFGIPSPKEGDVKGDTVAKAFDEGLSRQALSDYIQHNREGLALLSENLRRAKIRVESFKRLAIDRASDEVVGFSLQQVCDDLLRSMQVMLNNAGVNVDVTIAGDLQLQGYPGIVSQILQNLIVNAVIHGLTDISAGRVTLQAWQDDEAMVNIRVSDNGQGVRADIAGRLFDPFVTSARGQGSTGLGLHLVHQWVTHLLHGSIRVEESAREPGKQQSKSGLSLLLTFPAQISAA